MRRADERCGRQPLIARFEDRGAEILGLAETDHLYPQFHLLNVEVAESAQSLDLVLVKTVPSKNGHMCDAPRIGPFDRGNKEGMPVPGQTSPLRIFCLKRLTRLRLRPTRRVTIICDIAAGTDSETAFPLRATAHIPRFARLVIPRFRDTATKATAVKCFFASPTRGVPANPIRICGFGEGAVFALWAKTSKLDSSAMSFMGQVT